MAGFTRRSDSFTVEEIMASAKNILGIDVKGSEVLGLTERTIFRVNSAIKGYRDMVKLPVGDGFNTRKTDQFFYISTPSYINNIERIFHSDMACDVVTRNGLDNEYLYTPYAPIGKDIMFNANKVDSLVMTGIDITIDVTSIDQKDTTVNWGDGTTEDITFASSVEEISHTYSERGQYTITIGKWDDLSLNTEDGDYDVDEIYFDIDIQAVIKYGMPESPDYNIYMPYLYKGVIEAGVFSGILMRPQYDRKEEARKWEADFQRLLIDAISFERNHEPNVYHRPTHSF